MREAFQGFIPEDFGSYNILRLERLLEELILIKELGLSPRDIGLMPEKKRQTILLLIRLMKEKEGSDWEIAKHDAYLGKM